MQRVTGQRAAVIIKLAQHAAVACQQDGALVGDAAHIAAVKLNIQNQLICKLVPSLFLPVAQHRHHVFQLPFLDVGGTDCNAGAVVRDGHRRHHIVAFPGILLPLVGVQHRHAGLCVVGLGGDGDAAVAGDVPTADGVVCGCAVKQIVAAVGCVALGTAVIVEQHVAAGLHLRVAHPVQLAVDLAAAGIIKIDGRLVEKHDAAPVLIHALYFAAGGVDRVTRSALNHVQHRGQSRKAGGIDDAGKQISRQQNQGDQNQQLDAAPSGLPFFERFKIGHLCHVLTPLSAALSARCHKRPDPGKAPMPVR